MFAATRSDNKYFHGASPCTVPPDRSRPAICFAQYCKNSSFTNSFQSHQYCPTDTQECRSREERTLKHQICASSFFAMLFITACGGGGGGGGTSPAPTPVASPPPPPPPAVTQSATPTQFEEQSVLRGIVYASGYTNDMNAMVRQFAGGGAVGDIDADGDLDVFIVPGNSGPNRLYLNQGGVRLYRRCGRRRPRVHKERDRDIPSERTGLCGYGWRWRSRSVFGWPGGGPVANFPE